MRLRKRTTPISGDSMLKYLVAATAAAVLATPVLARVEPYPASFRTQMVQTNGTSLFVRVGGQGPAIVLLHGFGDTGDMWEPLATLLVKDHQVIVPDLRGMGLSLHPESGYEKAAQARDLAGILDTLKVQRFQLVTHDIGNMVGYALAAKFPLHARLSSGIAFRFPLAPS